MEDSQPIEKKTHNTSAPRGGPPKKHLTFPFEERLRAVKLHLEEGFTQEMVAEEMGISSAAVFKWTRRYRLQGEALKSQYLGRHKARPFTNGRSERSKLCSTPWRTSLRAGPRERPTRRR